MALPRSLPDQADDPSDRLDGAPDPATAPSDRHHDRLPGLDATPGEALADRYAQLRASVAGPSVRSILGVGVVAGVAIAGWWLLRPPPPPVEATLPVAQATAGTTGTGGAETPAGADPAGGAGGPAGAAAEPPEQTPLLVAAAGAVARPGVYELPAGARVDDLVLAAGGLGPDADGDRVNLAAPVADGERVWVPRTGETEQPEVVAGTGTAPPPPAAPGGSGEEAAPALIELNTATAEELETLPGVGPATSASIIAYRDENGGFSSVDELLEVSGIGPAKLEAVRDLVSV
jgi:competence protein ComEA